MKSVLLLTCLCSLITSCSQMEGQFLERSVASLEEKASSSNLVVMNATGLGDSLIFENESSSVYRKRAVEMAKFKLEEKLADQCLLEGGIIKKLIIDDRSKSCYKAPKGVFYSSRSSYQCSLSGLSTCDTFPVKALMKSVDKDKVDSCLSNLEKKYKKIGEYGESIQTVSSALKRNACVQFIASNNDSGLEDCIDRTLQNTKNRPIIGSVVSLCFRAERLNETSNWLESLPYLKSFLPSAFNVRFGLEEK
ncbi:hypothetical protein HBN50_02870 [Halobacteriovorax sp. GB3]|uniref:hypothetical protein n=1 Tax=Halobacteriovorax sp. GB3 TaxID=2719615 RepID=UPI002360BB40|nr:hypothetical protein [Halobacteriovorax sp. GB3]MDD0852017.1 hypothetical protein [Halobacteriovorax sp. GB3]